MDLDKFLKRIELEKESIDAGHEAVNRAKNFQLFSQNNLENIIIDTDEGDDNHFSENTEHSTFDEANYNLEYDL